MEFPQLFGCHGQEAHKFIWIDLDANGCASNAEIFNSSELRECIESGDIVLPADAPVTNNNRPIPFFIIGDDAFPLRTWLIKPFSQRNMEMDECIFNYQLSHACRVSENAFGIIVHGWRCIHRIHSVSMLLPSQHMLHPLYSDNLPLDRGNANHEIIPGEWRENACLTVLQRLRGSVGTRAAKGQRLYLKKYYSSAAGAVPWQNDMILIYQFQTLYLCVKYERNYDCNKII